MFSWSALYVYLTITVIVFYPVASTPLLLSSYSVRVELISQNTIINGHSLIFNIPDVLKCSVRYTKWRYIKHLDETMLHRVIGIIFLSSLQCHFFTQVTPNLCTFLWLRNCHILLSYITLSSLQCHFFTQVTPNVCTFLWIKNCRILLSYITLERDANYIIHSVFHLFCLLFVTFYKHVSNTLANFHHAVILYFNIDSTCMCTLSSFVN